jgi:hypothetical protein
MKVRFFKLNLYAGLTVFVLSWVLLFFGIPFVKAWFFCLAWWSFILILDSLNFRLRGSSPLSGAPALFLSKALFSVLVWNLFELFNLRLQNWSYHDLPTSRPERWLGYFVAFASVIPALEELALLVGPIMANRLRLFRFRVSPFLLQGSLFIGFLSIALSLLWPEIFFPLVWLGFIFLLEPMNYGLKNRSFISELDQDNWKPFWSWVVAGLLAGFFWEFFNFWAGSHWEYHLPYLDFGRVFEMPVLGFTGFLPFALEIFAFLQLFLWAARKFEKTRFLARAAVIIALLILCGGSFALIDRFTLRS